MAKLFASMSRRGNPYDNALAENFFSILKTECIHRAKLKSYEEDSLLITEYINFYNNYHIQTKTKLTPFEKTESVCCLTINFLHHPGPFVLSAQFGAFKGYLRFLVRRKGFSAAVAAIASLHSLPTAAKTAHRAVFFRMLRILPPCSNPFLCAVIIKNLRQHKLPEVFGTPEGIRTPDLLVRSNVDSH